MLTETEKAYLAGFFDGDGCVNISVRQSQTHATPSHYLQVIFSQCDQPFLERWCEKVGMGRVYVNSGRPIGNKELWHWRLYDRQAEKMLKMMLPYLDIKKEQAEIALSFMRTKGRGGRRATPAGLLHLREHYKDALSGMKREDAELPKELHEYQQLLDSQLVLF